MKSYKLVSKSKISERVRPLVDDGMLFYIELNDYMFKGMKWLDKTPRYISLEMMNSASKYFYGDVLDGLKIHEWKHMVNHLTKFSNSTREKIDSFFSNEYGIEDFCQRILNGDLDYDTLSTTYFNNEMGKFSLTASECKWFSERIKSTSYCTEQYSLKSDITHESNIVRLINKYRDKVRILPKRNPKHTTHEDEYFLNPMSTTDKFAVAIDMLYIGFKDEQTAKMFVNELVLPYKPLEFTINKVNTTSDSLHKGLSDRSYSVFISKKKKDNYGNMGYITPLRYYYTISDYANISDDEFLNQLSGINEFAKQRFNKLKRITDKYNLPEPIIACNVGHYLGRLGEIILENNSVKVIDYSKSLSSSFNKVNTGDFCSTPNMVLSLKEMQRVIWFSRWKSSRYQHSLTYDIIFHIPISNNTDITSFARMMNAMKLTKAFDPDYMTLTLYPFIADEKTQQSLLNLLDELTQ